ncbi:MAG: hypothetical protein ACREE7_18385 [Dongiaceae bacterium]
MTDADTHGRKILKQQGNVQMSQESFESPRGRLAFRYFVGLTEGPVRSFDKPHDAWDHFQRLTNLPATRRRDLTTTSV